MKEENDIKDFILICVVVAVFVFGYIVVKKVDNFLENNHRHTTKIQKDSLLRIAFEMPVVIESASQLMEKFSKKYPDCEFCLFCGSAQEIVNKLETNEIDFGFVTENSICTFNKKYGSIILPLQPNTITVDSIGYSVIPLEDLEIMTRVIWNEKMKPIIENGLWNI